MEPAPFVNRSAHGRDPELAAALKGARAMPGAGKPVLVAFRNEHGELYRFALLNGQVQLRYLRRRMVQLRLLADLDDADGMMTVVDAS